jgi:2,5-diketo-D-gluconate reductase A
VSVIPKSVTFSRIAENFGALNVKLSPSAMVALNALDQGENGRFFQQTWTGVPLFV